MISMQLWCHVGAVIQVGIFAPIALLLFYLMNLKVLISCFPGDFVINLASRLFFKQPTSWRPHTSKDIMISVASDMSGQSPGPYASRQLPVQVNICLAIV